MREAPVGLFSHCARKTAPSTRGQSAPRRLYVLGVNRHKRHAPGHPVAALCASMTTNSKVTTIAPAYTTSVATPKNCAPSTKKIPAVPTSDMANQMAA